MPLVSDFVGILQKDYTERELEEESSGLMLFFSALFV
jgi:hypothetical protein